MYAKKFLSGERDLFNKDEVIEWMSSKDECPTTETVTGNSQQYSVLNPSIASSSDTESDEGERFSLQQGLELGSKYLQFLEKQSFVTEQELMTVHRVQKKKIRSKTKITKTNSKFINVCKKVNLYLNKSI